MVESQAGKVRCRHLLTVEYHLLYLRQSGSHRFSWQSHVPPMHTVVSTPTHPPSGHRSGGLMRLGTRQPGAALTCTVVGRKVHLHAETALFRQNERKVWEPRLDPLRLR